MPPWVKIKADYLTGLTAVELSQKYDIRSKYLNEVISKRNWKDDKETICNNLKVLAEKHMETLNELAFKTLEETLRSSDEPTAIKLQAISRLFDVNGMKKESKDLKVAEQKRYLIDFVSENPKNESSEEDTIG